MKIAKIPSLLLALVLQVLPITRVFLATAPVTGSSFAVVPAWIAGLAALMGGYNAVSGASTRITSSGTATGSNGVAFSYRITVGPQSANRFSAVPLPTGLTCATSTGRITGIPTQTGVFSVLMTASDGGRASRTVTKNLALTILPGGSGSGPPSITTQPVNQTGTVGGSLTLTVVAAGTGPLSYHWQRAGIAISGGTNSTLSLTSLTTNHAGSYKVVVNNSLGSVTSSVAIVTVNPAPVAPSIATQPESVTVMAGSNATFSVAAMGTAPFRYQWRKGGVAVATATNATLAFAPAVALNAGNYTVVITNLAGSVTSRVATLTVTVPPTPDVLRPTLAVLSPASALTMVTSNSINLSGTAADNQSVASVFIQQNGGAETSATGTSNWSATAALLPGTNTFRIRSTDVAGNISLTSTRIVVYTVKRPLSLTVNGSGTLVGPTNGQLLELGKPYTLKAAARPGNVFSNWLVDGVSSPGATLSFNMASNLSVIANFVTNPFPALKGTYTGLFYPNTPEPPHEQSGQFTLTVTDLGAFSGRLLLAGGSYSVSGLLDLSLAGSKTILRKGTNKVVLRIQLSARSNQVSGEVSNAYWNSELFGYRTTFDARLNLATNHSGKYTMLLSGGEDAAVSPAGHSPATLDITTAGAVTIKGTLADGTAVVQKTTLAANGQTPVYVNLYQGKGSLVGWLTLMNTDTNDIPGLLIWTKKDSVMGNLYPGGFTNEVLTLASRYTPPANATAVVGFSNSVVILEGGNLTGPTTNEVFLGPLNKISVTSTNTSKLALAVTSASGHLSGSFVHPQTLKKSTIKGVVLQKQDLGGGFFLGTNQSGSVVLGRPEDVPVFTP